MNEDKICCMVLYKRYTALLEASQRENVLSKYYHIWNSKELSDVVITCKGGDTIQTHKFVLMGRLSN